MSIGNIRKTFYEIIGGWFFFLYFSATPVTTVDVDIDEIEEVQTIADDEEKTASNQSPLKADRSDADVPENFADIFSNDDSVDEVVEEAVEVTESTERTETIETEEKKEVDEVEHR